jgi:fatty acid desaturase
MLGSLIRLSNKIFGEHDRKGPFILAGLIITVPILVIQAFFMVLGALWSIVPWVLGGGILYYICRRVIKYFDGIDSERKMDDERHK